DQLVPGRVLAEGHHHRGGDAGVTGFVAGGQSGALSGQGHEAVKRPAVQQVPAQPGGDAAADGALARAGGPVDGNDRRLAHASDTRRPQAAAVAMNPGNAVATFSTSWRDSGSSAMRLATAEDMAMRWSLWLSICPPCRRAPPAMRMPSGSSWLGTPTRVRPSAITA